jgi:hypothetical protein
MNSYFEEGEFIIFLISLTQKSNKAVVSVKHGKDYKCNYFDIIVMKSRRVSSHSIQTKLFYNFGSQDTGKENQD